MKRSTTTTVHASKAGTYLRPVRAILFATVSSALLSAITSASAAPIPLINAGLQDITGWSWIGSGGDVGFVDNENINEYPGEVGVQNSYAFAFRANRSLQQDTTYIIKPGDVITLKVAFGNRGTFFGQIQSAGSSFGLYDAYSNERIGNLATVGTTAPNTFTTLTLTHVATPSDGGRQVRVRINAVNQGDYLDFDNVRLDVVPAVVPPAPVPVLGPKQTPTSVLATSSQLPVGNLINNTGLTETAPGSGLFKLSANPASCQWNSFYTNFGADENAFVDFNLGSVKTIQSFRVWNYNDSTTFGFRGFRDVSVYTSTNGTLWKCLPQRFRFAKAPGNNNYIGELYSFQVPVTTRYIRLLADSTYRDFGGSELAGLGKVHFYGASPNGSFPVGTGIVPTDIAAINVYDYGAVGNGIADDTYAIQSAIDAAQGTNRPVLIPAGTFLVSHTIQIRRGVGFGFTTIRGAGADLTRIVLKDNTFTDPLHPLPVLTCGYQGNAAVVFGADWFNVNVSDLKIHLGSGNGGAVGIEFYSNNWGSLRGVAVDATDGGGEIGIDLGYASLNGPCLVQACSVKGCRLGVRASDSFVNSVVLDDISLEGQREVGFYNQSQSASVGLLATMNTPQAARNIGGFLALSQAEAESYPDSPFAAVENLSGGGLASFGLATFGYITSIANSSGGTPAVGGSPATWASHPTLTLWPTTSTSWVTGNIGTFPAVSRVISGGANVRNYRLVTDPDDSAALQRAVNAGIATLYLPVGGAALQIGSTVTFNNPATKSLVGHHAVVNFYGTAAPKFKIPEGAVTTNVLTFDQLRTSGPGKVEGGATRPLYIRDSNLPLSLGGSTRVYLDNVTTKAFSINLGALVSARQLNVEDTGTLITNNGGTLRVLGLKTEHGSTIVSTLAGGTTEIIGGLVYLVDRGIGSNFPMFINQNSSVSLSITEMQFLNDPYLTLVEETRAGVTRRLKRAGQSAADALAPLTSNAQGSMIPWYVGKP